MLASLTDALLIGAGCAVILELVHLWLSGKVEEELTTQGQTRKEQA